MKTAFWISLSLWLAIEAAMFIWFWLMGNDSEVMPIGHLVTMLIGIVGVIVLPIFAWKAFW